MKDLFKVPVCTNNVNRFAGKQVLSHRSTISEHSFEVTYYSTLIVQFLMARNALTAEQGLEVNQYSLVHDIPEIFTGDVPYTAKARFPELKDALNRVEQEIWEEVLPTFRTPASAEAKFICKVADAIAVSREIITEYSMGNIFFGEEELENCRNIFGTCFRKYRNEVSNDVWKYTREALLGMSEGSSIEHLVKEAIGYAD